MRKLDQQGIREFRDAFAERVVADEAWLEAFSARLEDPDRTLAIAGCKPLLLPEQGVNRYMMAKAIHDALPEGNKARWLDDEGFIYWVTLRLGNHLFRNPEGRFNVMARARYVLGVLGTGMDLSLSYRQLIRTPLQTYIELEEVSAPLLSNHPSSPSGCEEHYSSRKSPEFSFIHSRSFMQTFNILFSTRDGNRRGLRSNAKEGFIRLIEVAAQLNATYDVGSMPPAALLRLLPREFDVWRRT